MSKLNDITTQEAKNIAKLAGVKIIWITPIIDRGNEGFRIHYSQVLSENTVSTKKKLEAFNLPLSDVIHQNFYPY